MLLAMSSRKKSRASARYDAYDDAAAAVPAGWAAAAPPAAAAALRARCRSTSSSPARLAASVLFRLWDWGGERVGQGRQEG